jgi:tRNA-guanine family transglycosylase
MDDAECPEIILGNTYHLASQPGTALIAEFDGLHKFMNWKHNMLTDSGGFQMVSLLKLAEITEQGVKFQHPVDGSEMMLTPEHSIKCQNEIGADIMMQLDDVVSSVNDNQERFQEAVQRSVRWLVSVVHALSCNARFMSAVLVPILCTGSLHFPTQPTTTAKPICHCPRWLGCVTWWNA